MYEQLLKGLGDDSVRIGAYQFAVSGSMDDNYHRIQSAIQHAIHKDVHLIIFPECALTGYPPRDIENSSVDFDKLNSMYKRIQEIVDTQLIYVILGSIIKKDDLCYNSALFFSPHREVQVYHKRALWGWDKDNFSIGQQNGVFDVDGWKIGVRICFEVRFPEFFRELYKENTDLNVILFYDTSDKENLDRYELIKSHVKTRAVENVTYTLAVDTCSSYQTAPTILYDRSGHALRELERNKEGLLIFDLLKQEMNFGEMGRKEISDWLMKG